LKLLGEKQGFLFAKTGFEKNRNTGKKPKKYSKKTTKDY